MVEEADAKPRSPGVARPRKHLEEWGGRGLRVILHQLTPALPSSPNPAHVIRPVRTSTHPCGWRQRARASQLCTRGAGGWGCKECPSHPTALDRPADSVPPLRTPRP
eukprot:9950803-Alexandrium_andersonii.AAC.1